MFSSFTQKGASLGPPAPYPPPPRLASWTTSRGTPEEASGYPGSSSSAVASSVAASSSSAPVPQAVLLPPAPPTATVGEAIGLPVTGTLEKQSELLGVWQPRRLELDKGLLQYFKDGCVEPRGTFRKGDVLDVCAELPTTVLVLARQAGGDERTYALRAGAAEDMYTWVRLIRQAFDLTSIDDGSGSPGGLLSRRLSDAEPSSPLRRHLANSNSFGAVSSAGSTLMGCVTGLVATTVAGVTKATGTDTWFDEKMETAKGHITGAKRSMAGWREQLEHHMEDAITSCDETRAEELLDKALGFQVFTGDRAPAVVRRAARRAAGRSLRDATAAGDPKRLKGALVAARRLQAVDVPEFAPAVAKYREVRRIPEGWDIEKMLAERRAGAAKLISRPDVSGNHALRALVQLMFDRTLRRVETRDRRGPMPQYLQVVQVAEVQNAEMWADYLVRREAIKVDIRRMTPAGSSLPPGYMLIDAETQKALSEAEVTVASTDVHVRMPSSSSPGSLMDVTNPVTGEVLRLAIPADANTASPCRRDREVPIAELLAASLPGPPLETAANEVWLFHGTKPLAAESITSNDFRVDLAGTSSGSLYGRGIYLAENCTKADEYSHADKADLYTMLLCRTTLGKVLYNDERLPDPRKCEDACLKGDCHAVLGDRKKCRGTFREFCVFDEDQIYPNYLVTYRRILPPAGSS